MLACVWLCAPSAAGRIENGLWQAAHPNNSVSVQGTADEFCRRLELTLDRPVVNETNLEGSFDFEVEASPTRDTDFLDLLRDRLGLVIAPDQRNVEVLVFRKRD